MWNKFVEILVAPERWRRRDDPVPRLQITAQGKPFTLFRIEGKVIQVVRLLHSALDSKQYVSKGSIYG